MLPILYHSSHLVLYSYPIMMGIGWGVAYQIFFSQLDSSLSKLKGQIIFWGIFFSAWLGSKLFFYITHPQDLSLIDASFWIGGGFVFYGGFILGLLFLLPFIISDNNFKKFWPSSILPALAIGHSVGRFGCFLAGCCFGKPTSLFWGIYLHNHFRHPTQLIESFGLLLIGIFLLKSKKDNRWLTSIYLLSYGFLRLSIESLRGDLARGMWGFFTPSQWISIALIISGILLCLPRKTVT
jgi:phosphatidylglycerol---prolipoprotein diacylglyceryl transferase